VEVHEDDPIASLYEEKMGHMTEKDSEFFRKWENLLTVEEQDIGRLKKELWTMGAEEREKRGR
jgi:DNA replication ATP-dependent helicase Dna2